MFLLVSVDNDSNYGTEKQEGDVYHNGNSEPKGFGKLSFLCTVYFVFYFYLFVCAIVLSDQNFSCGKCGLPSLGRASCDSHAAQRMVHAGCFQCFHNPLNSAIDYAIFNMCKYVNACSFKHRGVQTL